MDVYTKFRSPEDPEPLPEWRAKHEDMKYLFDEL